MKIKITYPLLFLIISVFGLGVAAFLWYSTVQIKVIGCLTGGCEAVLSSPHAKIFTVPIAAYGFAFYAVGVLVALFRMFGDTAIIRLTSWAMGVAGVLFSVYFLYLELFKIHAICFWCKFSTLSTILLIILVIIEIRKRGGINAIKSDLTSLKIG
jgi:uncharacterized membrane protein